MRSLQPIGTMGYRRHAAALRAEVIGGDKTECENKHGHLTPSPSPSPPPSPR